MGKINKKHHACIYIILIIGAFISSIPMIYMISTAFKPNQSLYEYPPKLIPDKFILDNFKYIFTEANFYRNFINSTIVSLFTIFISAFVASSLAYCLARFHFRGKNALFTLIMATMIIPGTTLIVPQFELAVWLNFTDKLMGLIPFYVSWVIPFSTFMIKGFIEDIPVELDEAAYIDGAGIFTIYNKVIFPLISPAIGAVSIFNFLTAWEEYPWALTVINDLNKRTLPIAIAGFFGQHNFTQWGCVFAMSTISLIPIILVFLIFQNFFVSGLSAGAIKE